jgi:hypothetical protein
MPNPLKAETLLEGDKGPIKIFPFTRNQHHGSLDPGLSLSLMAGLEAKNLVVGEDLTNAKSMTNMVRLRYSSVILVRSSLVNHKGTKIRYQVRNSFQIPRFTLSASGPRLVLVKFAR